MSQELRNHIKQEINRIRRQSVVMRKMPDEQELNKVIPGDWIPQGHILKGTLPAEVLQDWNG